jgi:AbrB family looped-hinge helix DNA binding protein
VTTARVSTKGQIVLPAEMRRRLGIRPGTTVEVVDAGDHLVVVPTVKAPATELRGLLRGEGSLTEALLAERRAERSSE